MLDDRRINNRLESIEDYKHDIQEYQTQLLELRDAIIRDLSDKDDIDEIMFSLMWGVQRATNIQYLLNKRNENIIRCYDGIIRFATENK